MENLKLEILVKDIPKGVTHDEYRNWLYYELGIHTYLSDKNPMFGKKLNLQSDKYDVRCTETNQESL